MDWKTGILQALSELTHHKLRTLLTLLGMIFGVGAVISMLAIGDGAEREAMALIDSLGLRNVIVESIKQPEERLKEIREESLGLNLRDVEVALDTLPQVEEHTAVKRVNVFSLFSDDGKSDAEVIGVSPSHFDMAGLELAKGREITDRDNLAFAPLCVIGAQVARDLFGTRDPLGEQVKVNHVWLRVIGVLADEMLQKDEFQGVALDNPQNKVYLPLQSALKRFRFKPMETQIDEFRLRVAQESSIGSVATTLDRLLSLRHGEVSDYKLVVPEQLLAQQRQTQRIFDIVMASIAGISLLVGGIGIMNIMLATVLERTREIGIRRAIGAKQKDIRRQFLIEASTISFVGGFLGIVVGFALAGAISLYSGWAVAVSIRAPLIAVAVCALVGLGFGIYPATKAARLDPIVALNRHV